MRWGPAVMLLAACSPAKVDDWNDQDNECYRGPDAQPWFDREPPP